MKLYRLLAGKFVLIQPDPYDEDEGEEGSDAQDDASDRGSSNAVDSDEDEVMSDARPKPATHEQSKRKDSKGEDLVGQEEGDENEEEDAFLKNLPTEPSAIVAAKA